jgi:hypothetical protein
MDEKMSLFEELVNEQVEVLRNKLLTTFLSSDNFPESQDNISCVTMEQITDDTLITDDNESVISNLLHRHTRNVVLRFRKIVTG